MSLQNHIQLDVQKPLEVVLWICECWIKSTVFDFCYNLMMPIDDMKYLCQRIINWRRNQNPIWWMDDHHICQISEDAHRFKIYCPFIFISILVFSDHILWFFDLGYTVTILKNKIRTEVLIKMLINIEWVPWHPHRSKWYSFYFIHMYENTVWNLKLIILHISLD